MPKNAVNGTGTTPHVAGTGRLPAKDSGKTYTMSYTCQNCGVAFKAKIPFGTPIAKANVACTNCGVSKLRVDG